MELFENNIEFARWVLTSYLFKIVEENPFDLGLSSRATLLLLQLIALGTQRRDTHGNNAVCVILEHTCIHVGW